MSDDSVLEIRDQARFVPLEQRAGFLPKNSSVIGGDVGANVSNSFDDLKRLHCRVLMREDDVWYVGHDSGAEAERAGFHCGEEDSVVVAFENPISGIEQGVEFRVRELCSPFPLTRAAAAYYLSVQDHDRTNRILTGRPGRVPLVEGLSHPAIEVDPRDHIVHRPILAKADCRSPRSVGTSAANCHDVGGTASSVQTVPASSGAGHAGLRSDVLATTQTSS